MVSVLWERRQVKVKWDVGIGFESFTRKRRQYNKTLKMATAAPGIGEDESYRALSSTAVCVLQDKKPQRVSTYNVDAASHVYSLTGYSSKARFPPTLTTSVIIAG